VGLHRGLAPVEVGRNLGVAVAPSYGTQHVNLPFGQPAQGFGSLGAGRGRRTKRSTSLRVTDGASRASPATIQRRAAYKASGGVVMSRKPLAPAWSAAYAYRSRSKVVKIKTVVLS
jgi:hypothetical protein